MRILAHLRKIYRSHRHWGWVAEVDAHGNVRPASARRRIRNADRPAGR